MSETSASLLDRIRRQNDDSGWQRLVSLYLPLIHSWMRRDVRLNENDADDIAQEVLAVVVRRIGEFERQRTGSFRAWLKAITVNCLRQSIRHRQNYAIGSGDSRVVQLLQELEDPDGHISSLWNREHDEFVMKHLLHTIKDEFAKTTWQAFEQFAVLGRPADAVAAELGMTANAVFIAKSRVMTRLRQEAEGLID